MISRFPFSKVLHVLVINVLYVQCVMSHIAVTSDSCDKRKDVLGVKKIDVCQVCLLFIRACMLARHESIVSLL